MSDDVVIRVEGLGKKYLIGHEDKRERYVALRDVIGRGAKNAWRKTTDMVQGREIVVGDTVEEFWALKDVNFEVKRGEVMGIIGRNGAGKSTLLKILSRITEPSEGRVTIDGRVASLLEVGTGFHPELTGRENIYLNGAILGMTHAEIKRKFAEIVAFAEVEKFLDTPVKRFSSGMYVRLAFAVAVHLEPEILIIDEVLAVGDATFQQRSIGKMSEVASGGRTVIFVSHDMGAIDALTQKCMLLERGRISQFGDTAETVSHYLLNSVPTTSSKLADLNTFRRRNSGDAPVKIAKVVAAAPDHPNTSQIPNMSLGTKLIIRLEIEVLRAIEGVNITVIIKNNRGMPITVLMSWDYGFRFSAKPGIYSISISTGGFFPSPGGYVVDVGIDPSMNAISYDAIFDYPILSIVNDGKILHWPDRRWGAVHCGDVCWSVDGS